VNFYAQPLMGHAGADTAAAAHRGQHVHTQPDSAVAFTNMLVEELLLQQAVVLGGRRGLPSLGRSRPTGRRPRLQHKHCLYTQIYAVIRRLYEDECE